MAWSPIPTPGRRDDEIVVDDAPIVIDDIEIIDEPRIIDEQEDLPVIETPQAPGPTEAEANVEDSSEIRTLFGPEMTAGISLVVLFAIFAIVLISRAPQQPREQTEQPVAEETSQDPPAVAPQVIEVEIGEPLVLERGE